MPAGGPPPRTTRSGAEALHHSRRTTENYEPQEGKEEVPRCRAEVKNNPSVSSNRLPLDPVEDCLLKRKLVVHILPDKKKDAEIDGFATGYKPVNLKLHVDE